MVTELTTTLELELSKCVDELERRVDDAHHVLELFHATPPIEAIPRTENNSGIDPIDGSPLALWYARIQTIFRAYMQNNAELFQARIIRLSDGKEVVRVERSNQGIDVIANNKLQDKSDTEYFSAAKQLRPGEFHISPINLNREWGKIQLTFKPVFRLLKNIYDEDNQAYGFVIIDIDAKEALAGLTDNLPAITQLYLINPDGGAIIHPDSNQEFRFEVEQGAVWNQRPAQKGQGLFSNFSVLSSSGEEGFYFISQTISLSSTISDNTVTMIIGFSESSFAYEIANRRSTSVLIVIALVTLMIIFMLGFYRYINRRETWSEKQATFEAIVDDSVDAIISVNLGLDVHSWNCAAE